MEMMRTPLFNDWRGVPILLGTSSTAIILVEIRTKPATVRKDETVKTNTHHLNPQNPPMTLTSDPGPVYVHAKNPIIIRFLEYSGYFQVIM